MQTKTISIKEIDKKLYNDWVKSFKITPNLKFVSVEDKNLLNKTLINKIESELSKSRISVLSIKDRHLAIAKAIRYIHIYGYVNDVNLDNFLTFL